MSVARTVRALSPSPRSAISTSSQSRHVRKAILHGTPKRRHQLQLSPNNSDYSLSPISPGRGADGRCNRTPLITVQLTPELSRKPSTPDFEPPSDAAFLSPSVFRSSLFATELKVDVGCPSNSFLYTPEKETKFLGRGTFGNVSLCRYQNHKFAVKIIRRSSASPIGERHLLGIEHPHLVRILKISELHDRVFVSMEFCGHCNLQQVLDGKGDIDFRIRVSFAKQVASGLNHCHLSGIVHGDVKPANVIVSPSGHCKLGDFGHSVKEVDSIARRIDLKYFRGTAAYAAPEVLQGTGYSTASDIYSFGITLWQIYTREMPYANEHPHAIIYKVVKQSKRPNFDIPENSLKENYVKLTVNCWNKKHSNRPTADQVLFSLESLLENTENIP